MHSHASSAYTQVYMLCRSSISTPLVVCRSETRGDADPLGHPRAPSLTEPGFANLVTGARAMTRADNRGLAEIPVRSSACSWPATSWSSSWAC